VEVAEMLLLLHCSTLLAKETLLRTTKGAAVNINIILLMVITVPL
jgi:hypothetical protein